MGATEDSTRGQWRGLNTALTFVLLSAPFFVFQIFGSGTTGESSLPVSIRAASQADYSQDSQTYKIPPINENILNEIIANVSATYSVQDRMATLQADLSSPVPIMTIIAPSVTPTPTLLPQTSTRTVTGIPTNTGTLATTPTALTPTATATPRVQTTPTTASTNTTQPTPGLPTLPPSLPTIPPILPTLPPILPTLPPILPTLPPILPTLPPLLPTVLPILPTILPGLP